MQKRRPYRPNLVPLGFGRFEQRFTTNDVLIEETQDYVSLEFREMLPSYGSVHSLLITLPPPTKTESWVELEFNERGNDVGADGIRSIRGAPGSRTWIGPPPGVDGEHWRA